jgi:ubiquinone/menaquinone biosynthesis C-methylase UbiE
LNSLKPIRSQIRSGWERTSSCYGKDQPQVFQRFANRLVELIDWSPGQHVLDIGAGTGIVALIAAKRIGLSGSVIGVDFAYGMMLRARNACDANRPKVLLTQMDAEFLGFPDESFDRVTCAFSLFQFVNMPEALNQMHRVLKPGGLVGLSNWGPEFFTPVGPMQRDLFRQYHIRPLLPNPITFKLGQMKEMLQAGGFSNVRLIYEHIDLWFEGPEEIWEWNLAMGPFPIMLEQQLTPDQQRDLKLHYIEMLDPLRTMDGIQCAFHPLYALAYK